MSKAVVVGINAYAQSPLQGCVNDADDVIEYLRGPGGLAADDVLRLCDARATKRAIVTALRAMVSSSTAGEHLLFHYSGHGAQLPSRDVNEPDGLDEVLCPVDFTWEDSDTAFTDNELADILASVPAGVALTVVIDSCHSGDLSKDGRSAPRFMRPPPDLACQLRTRRRRTVHRARSTSNSVVVSACRSEETAADTSFLDRPNGAFTYNWMSALNRTPTASVRGLVATVTASLASFNMHPELDGSLALEDSRFLITPPPGGRTYSPRTRAPLSSDRLRGERVSTARSSTGPIASAESEPSSGGYVLPCTGANVLGKAGLFDFRFNLHPHQLAEETNMISSDITTTDSPMGNWDQVHAELERRHLPSPALFSGTMGAFTPYPVLDTGLAPRVPPSLLSIKDAPRAASGAPVVRTFFWGFHIEVSSQSLRDFMSVADPIAAIVAAIGPITGPAAPFVTLAAAFAAGALQVLRGLDHGNGIYISMSWFAPGVFIPTTVTGRGMPTASVSRPRGIQNLEPEVTGGIFRVNNAIYTTEDSNGDGLKRFTLRAANVSGDWVDVNIDRSQGVVATGHISKGQSGGLSEASQLYVNRRNKITRWRPGVFGVPGNAGGEVFFNVPLDAHDILIELDVIG